MVETKLIPFVAALMVISSCGYNYAWESYVVDGSITGVTAPTADNVDQALGTVEDGVYTAPNGKVFIEGTVMDVARNMISVQPEMADLKTVVGHASHDMGAERPESELSNWAVDCIMRDTEKATGHKVDVGILNFGGIRVDLAAGDITKDDVMSMFPFRNYLCYVCLKGEDLKAIFDHMAEYRVEVLGGVKLVVADKKVESVEVGGEPFDPQRWYGVATVDFLLDGGDHLYVAKNAKELIITDMLVVDSILPHVIETTAVGKDIEYFIDGRVVVK